MKPGKIPDANSNRIKDPDDWVTGDEEMTGAQESYPHTLAEEAHEPIEAELTKAEASKIDRLQAKTGRGRRASRARNPSGRRENATHRSEDRKSEHEGR